MSRSTSVKCPIVSLVMRTYNSATYLREAIESVLRQTFSDFEFIVVDGESTDGTDVILKHYEHLDKRVNVIRGRNTMIEALNIGCNMAKGMYVAIMDSDDVSLPDRFEKQVSFLENHRDVGACGSAVETIDARGNHVGFVQFPITYGFLQWQLLFGGGIAHSAVMMRHEAYDEVGGYRNEAVYDEDYDIYVRLEFTTKWRLVNLPDVLVRYRLHRQSVGARIQYMQLPVHLDNMQSALSYCLREITAADVKTIAMMFEDNLENTVQAYDVLRLLRELRRRYLAKFRPEPRERAQIDVDYAGKILTAYSQVAKRAQPLCPIPFIAESLLASFLAVKVDPNYFSERLVKRLGKKLQMWSK